jgi:hypothetical protein
MLECKKRDINTPDVKTALEFLEPLARKFRDTRCEGKDEIWRLAKEYRELEKAVEVCGELTVRLLPLLIRAQFRRSHRHCISPGLTTAQSLRFLFQ